MQPVIEQHLPKLRSLCRRFHVRRLELFGSAAREDFDPARSDLDFLVAFDRTHRDALSFRTYFGPDRQHPRLARYRGRLAEAQDRAQKATRPRAKETSEAPSSREATLIRRTVSQTAGAGSGSGSGLTRR